MRNVPHFQTFCSGGKAARARRALALATRFVLIETFVEKPRFTGIFYKAADWCHLGDTQSRGPLDTLHLHINHQKYLGLSAGARFPPTSLQRIMSSSQPFISL